MKLQLTFPVDGAQKSIVHEWDRSQDCIDNLAVAFRKAEEQGLKKEDIKKVKMKSFRDFDGERCPCCDKPLIH